MLCSENNLKDIQSVLKEMYRVLKTGGVYLMISHGAPDHRVNHIKRYIEVDIDVVPIRKYCIVVGAFFFPVHLYFSSANAAFVVQKTHIKNYFSPMGGWQ